jgi:cytochrome oxidase Cu insertion factor (SCO1/SenC/PrrC family)
LLLALLLLPLGSHASQIGGDFSLTDHRGAPFNLQQMRGKVVLLFFGYTHCPDICPTELASVAAVLDALKERAAGVQGLFITVDPERDTPEVLASYVPYFSSMLIGLTGSAEEIGRVAAQYRARYRKQPRDDGRYAMEHSAQLHVIDTAGSLVTAIPYGLPAEHILNVVDELLRRRSGERLPQAGAPE